MSAPDLPPLQEDIADNSSVNLAMSFIVFYYPLFSIANQSVDFLDLLTEGLV